eukprot:9059-Heterococcus_DN1.PRE.1
MVSQLDVVLKECCKLSNTAQLCVTSILCLLKPHVSSRYAAFEERCKEFDRARVIYKYALDQMPRESVPDLYREFTSFEKRHGSIEGIEEVIVGKRRLAYEEEVAKDAHNYDAWFDYVRLEEAQ